MVVHGCCEVYLLTFLIPLVYLLAWEIFVAQTSMGVGLERGQLLEIFVLISYGNFWLNLWVLGGYGVVKTQAQ